MEDETFLHNTEYSEYSYWNEIKGTVRGTINDAKEFDEVIKSIQVLCEVPNYANFERVMGHWVGYSYEIGSKEYSVGMYYLPENSNYAYLTINYRDLSISSESHDTYTAFVDISEFKVRFEEYVRNNVLQENINDFQKN